MGSLFSIDSGFYRALTYFSNLVLLCLLWLICSIPIITIGASTTALFDISMHLVDQKESGIIFGFFKSFKNNFLQSTIINIIFIVMGAVIGFNFFFWYQTDSDIGTVMLAFNVFVLIAYIFTLMYVYPSQAKFDTPVLTTIKNSFLMSLIYIPYTIIIIAIVILAFWMTISGTIPVVIFGFLSPVFFTFIMSNIFVIVFNKHIEANAEVYKDYISSTKPLASEDSVFSDEIDTQIENEAKEKASEKVKNKLSNSTKLSK